MTERTNKLQGKQEPEPTKESRERLTDDGLGWKKGSPKGLASPKPREDKIAKELVANAGKNPTLPSSLAMADLLNNLQGNRESVSSQETRTSKEHRTDGARGGKDGKKRGLASPKPLGDKIANNVTTSKKMDDRVKKGEQWKDEKRGAVRARMEQKRASGPPPPKRGAVTKAIAVDLKEVMVTGVKKVIDTGKVFCCAPEPSVVDAILVDFPFPTWSEPTATLWAKVEV